MLHISLVIPNFESGATLERALRSVLDQHYPALQLILADGDSQDESSEIIERYRDHFAPLIRRRDDGQVDALNYAFERATGELHGWLCADDELLPGSLAAVSALFERNPELEVVAGACEHCYPDGSRRVCPVEPWAWKALGARNTLNQPSVFWRAGLHRRLGALDPSFALAFDWDFWCRMRAAGARFTSTHAVLSRYYFSQSNKSSVGGRRHVEEGLRIVRRYGPFHGWLARAYQFLYTQFDLKGCMDLPPSSSAVRQRAYVLTWHVLRRTIGMEWLQLYNWHFAALQERGLDWWRGEGSGSAREDRC